jgi:protein phosphatase
MKVRIQSNWTRFFGGRAAPQNSAVEIRGYSISELGTSASAGAPDSLAVIAAEPANPVEEIRYLTPIPGRADSPAACEAALGSLRVHYHYATHTGLVRERNEDACGVFVPPFPEVLLRCGVLALVADGMGGHECGDVASRLVLNTVSRAYYESGQDDLSVALSDALKAANLAIVEEARVREVSMGSTCSAVAICGQFGYAAHVGDSRIYRKRGSTLEQLTLDDSIVGEMKRRGMLTEEQAKSHPERNVLLNALGQQAEVSVFSWPVPLEVEAGDLFLICSDGLHSLISIEEIDGQLDDQRALPDIGRSLVEMALNLGGNDNISIVLLRARE